MRYVLGLFIVLHGLVHLLYAGQSRRLFELKAGMIWPDQSWLFGRILATGPLRSVAGVGLAVVCVLFVVAGAGMLFSLGWWRTLALVSAAASSAVYLFFWDGRMHALPDQGAVGIAINAALVVFAAASRWPAF